MPLMVIVLPKLSSFVAEFRLAVGVLNRNLGGYGCDSSESMEEKDERKSKDSVASLGITLEAVRQLEVWLEGEYRMSLYASMRARLSELLLLATEWVSSLEGGIINNIR